VIVGRLSSACGREDTAIIKIAGKPEQGCNRRGSLSSNRSIDRANNLYQRAKLRAPGSFVGRASFASAYFDAACTFVP
jgi:hypothetical protein